MRRRTVRILTVVAVVLVLLGLIYSVAVGIAAVRLRGAYAALKEDGRPMAREDVIPPSIPDRLNAALLYESAALLLKAQYSLEKDFLEYLGNLSGEFTDGSISPDKLTELKGLFERDAVVRALWIVEQGTQRDSCRFEIDYNAGISMSLTALRNMRYLASILGAKALFDAQAGHPDIAWEAIRTQLRLADSLRAEPIIVSQLVRIGIVHISCVTIRRLAEIERPNGRLSADIEGLLTSFDNVQPLVNAIDGDRLLFGEWAFNLPRRELLRQHELFSGQDDVLAVLGACFKPLRLEYQRSYLRIMHKSASFMEQPHSPDQVRAVNEMIEQKSRGLARSLVPALARVKVIHTSMKAEIRIIQAGLALLQSKQAGGTFPQNLAQFDPAQVEDPFSGESLIYRAGAEDFLLYSVGFDEDDNGGRQKQDNEKKGWDIVWQFPGPKKTLALVPETVESSLPGELILSGEYIERLVLDYQDGSTRTFERPGKSITLPAGQYRLREVTLEGGFRRDRKSIYHGEYDAIPIQVTADKPAILNTGGPIRHLLKVEKDGLYLRLEHCFMGVGGERYYPVDESKSPEFTVYHGDRKIASDRFKPTRDCTGIYSWRVPLTVGGNLRIVPTADTGVIGPSEGTAVLFYWKWYSGPARFIMLLLVGLAIVLVKENRNVRTLVILLPLLSVVVLWILLRVFLPSDSGLMMAFDLVIFSVTVGVTLLCLLAKKLSSLNPPVAFLLAMVIMVVVGTIGLISHDLQFDGDVALSIIMQSMLASGMLVGFIMAARACRRSYSLTRFVTRMGFWILLCSIGLMAVLWLFGFKLGDFDFGELLECLFVGGLLGLFIFAVNVPFVVMAFRIPFVGERLHACLRLEPAQQIQS